MNSNIIQFPKKKRSVPLPMDHDSKMARIMETYLEKYPVGVTYNKCPSPKKFHEEVPGIDFSRFPFSNFSIWRFRNEQERDIFLQWAKKIS